MDKKGLYTGIVVFAAIVGLGGLALYYSDCKRPSVIRDIEHTTGQIIKPNEMYNSNYRK